jgi:ketosteroid isomerase-like protein
MQYIYCMSFRLGLVLCALIAIPSLASANAEEEVVSAIRSRLDATRRNDVAAWSKFVADDMMAPLEGALPSKQGWIRQHESWPREVAYWYGPLEDIKVRINADIAIVTYHARQFTQIGGQTTSVHKWQIETHVRRDGRWQLLGVADGLIPPEPTAAKVDPSVLGAYAGEYEWAPTLISKIEPKGDRLLEHFGGGDAGEWLPESETTFFVPGEAAGGDSSRIIFVKDDSGRVTHYIYRELGATDRIVRKVR